MSTCVSRHGEYSAHTPDADYVCTLCFTLDEAALKAELNLLRANQLPAGGAWDVEYESPDGSDGPYWSDHHWFDSTRQRRVWFGPAEPIEASHE